MRYLLALIFLTQATVLVRGQSAYLPLNRDFHHIIDRKEIGQRNFDDQLHTSFKPYSRLNVATFIADSAGRSSDVDKANARYILQDNGEFTTVEPSRKPLFKRFYKNPADMVSVNVKDFRLQLSPVIYVGLGRDSNSASSPSINTRGVEFRGSIDDKITFYSFLAENQAVFARYVQDYINVQGAVPNEGFWKSFNTNGVDFFTTRAYIQLQASKHISLQFGHDRNFIGNGYRSLLLSDYSSSYPFLKLQTQVWKIQYTNLFAQLIADAPFTSGALGGSLGTAEFPKKFMTLHHLSINLAKNFNLGIFESVIFHRGDSTSSAFELNYLNPIIFYRSVEQQVGSPDNAFLGIDFKWNIRPGISFYGQGMLDELVIGEVTSGSGWWSNKYAFQLGTKWIDVLGISNVDLQLEYNFARPFIYSHESMFTNYSHYRQPLAHPLGANFKEWVMIARYQPIPKLFLTAQVIKARYGRDPDGQNLGGDILKSYLTPTQEFGNTTGQGIGHDLTFADLTVSYMLKHNLFVDLKHIYRKLDIEGAANNPTTQFTSLSLRLNIAARDYSF